MKETNRVADGGKTAIPISEKYMLTIKEASEYFNIGIKNMRRMAEQNTGFYAVFLGNRYLIVRRKFEEYMNSLTMGEEENTSSNITSMGNHTLSTVGGWNLRISCQLERNHAFPFGNWRSRLGMTLIHRWTLWERTSR